jgi:hypothetical protein
MFCRPVMLHMLNFVSGSIQVTEGRKYFPRGLHVGRPSSNLSGYLFLTIV